MLVDKPSGLTSHDVVARVRRALKTRAAGHTGTLDPFATGLLVVLVGRATRLARFVEAQDKTYLATARLGVATETIAKACPSSALCFGMHCVGTAVLAAKATDAQRDRYLVLRR